MQVSDNLEEALADPAWILVAIPSHAYRDFLATNASLFKADVGIAWASKGLENDTGKLIHQVIAEELPGNVRSQENVYNWLVEYFETH